jgi:hypothetical protein
MILVYAYTKKEAWLVQKSLRWMKELGGCKGHQCVLMVSSDVRGEEEYKLAQEVFDKVGAEKVPDIDLKDVLKEKHFFALANSMWQHAANYANTKFKGPWFYMEADCIPIKPMWLDQIEAAYKTCGKPFLITSGGIPPHHNLCGNAVYPAKVHSALVYTQPHLPPMEAMAAITTVTEPWDAFIRDNKVGTAFTDLIHHDYGNKPGEFEGQPLRFTSRTGMQKIMDSKAVVVHRCKDGSCIDVLSTRPEDKSFMHSGDLGDIIYAMDIIKNMGGGIVYIQSDRNCREPMTPKRAALIEPLLRSQDYIKDVRWWKDEIVAFDFSEFRKEHKPDCSLLESQRKYIGAPPINPEFPWLSIQGNGNGKIVINRTERYNNPTFPWKRLVELYGSSMVFLGHPEEYQSFSNAFGEVEYQATKDLLEAGVWIAGSHCFIGNQSSLYSIAEGIKHRRICEVSPHSFSQNVFLGGGQVQYCLSGSLDESWLQSVVSKDKPKTVKATKKVEIESKKSSGSVEDAIIADSRAGMKWKDLIKKHKVMPVKLKAILAKA